MEYTGNIIRPPSEADSIILQVTVGCSYNKCTFCAAYKNTPFQVKDLSTVEADLLFAQRYFRRKKRLFLADGDVLVLSQKKLLALFEKIRTTLPWIKRISLYGNARAIRNKSVDQLCELKENGLDRIYMGLESGCDEVLKNVQKGETGATMTAAAEKVNQAGIFLSVTVLLGLGEIALSQRHALKSAEVLCNMKPNQIAALTLMALDNTPLGEAVQSGSFILPPPRQILMELYLLVSRLRDIRCQFHANHASTFLPIAGRLPKDRELLMESIEKAINGLTPLVPDSLRAL